MTREEAIETLRNAAWLGSNDDRQKVEDAVELAITALQAQDVDAISRQAVMWMLTNLSYTQCKTQGEIEVIGLAKTMLIAMPSAQASYRQVTGKLDITDCISRQAAIDAIEKNAYRHTYVDQIIDIVSELPSAQLEPSQVARDIATILENEQDMRVILSHQAEVIRCKDCKYWMPHSQLGFDEDNEMYHDYCKKLIPDDEYYAFYRNANDYCSRAEWRTDGVDS